MAENVAITPGSGKTVLADEITINAVTGIVGYGKLLGGADNDDTRVHAGGGVEANALRVTIATDSTGVVSVDDNGGSLTVDGSVTANAGTNLNTSALALEAGGNLAGAATSLAVLDDWDESDRAKVNPIVGQAGVAAGAGAVGANTQRMTLASDDPAVSAVSAQSSFDHARTAVGTSAVQLQAGSIAAKKGVMVKAANANTGIIYVGNSDVTAGGTAATDGFELGNGESIFLEIDNVNKVYCIASATSQNVFWTVI